MICTSKSDGSSDCYFSIKKKNMELLKIKIALDAEAALKRAHLKNIKRELL
jgi:hypothetical protein